MNTIKVMSIIGIVIFSICFLATVGFLPEATIDSGYSATDIENAEAVMGLGILVSMYGIAYSITCLVQSNKVKKEINN